MTITRAQAYVIKCFSRGIETNFDTEFHDESDKIIKGPWIRDLILGWLLTVHVHQQVHQAYDDHRVKSDGSTLAVGPRGLCLRGAIVDEAIDLTGCGSAHEPLPALSWKSCTFKGTQGLEPNIDLSNAHLCSLELVGSRLMHLRGVGMCVAGSVEFSEICSVDKSDNSLCWAKLSRCVIDGHLIANGARMRAPTDELKPTGQFFYYDWFELNWAFNLYASRIAGSVTMRNRPVLHGGVLLDRSQVQGDVLIDGATIVPCGSRAAAIGLD